MLRTGIGPAGGTVQSGGTTVVIPPGALATDTPIAIAPSTATPPTSIGTLVGAVVDVGPSGTAFATPVTITLTYDPGLLVGRPPAAVSVATEQGGKWVRLPSRVDPATHTVSAQVTHLTPFVPTAVTTGISGTIRNTAGAPIAGAAVAAVTRSGVTCTELTSTEVATDAAGEYTLDLAAGTYLVLSRAFSPLTAPLFYQQAPDCELAQAVTVTAATIVTGIDITLGDAYVFGNVHDSVTGSGIAGASVRAWSGGALVNSATTAANGVFVLPLSNGTFTLEIQPPAGTLWTAEWYDDRSSAATATPLTLAGNNQFLSLDLVRRGISGTVTDASTSAGLAGALVTIYDSAGASVVTVTTGASGQYEAFLPDGTYRVGVTKAAYRVEYWDDRLTLASADPVTVAANVAAANVALTPLVTLSGTVTDATSGSGIAGIEVRVLDLSCVAVTTVTTSASGTYSVQLVADSYEVQFVSPDGRYIDAWDGGTSCANATIHLLNADTTVDMQLTPRPVAIYGTVRDGLAVGVGGAKVRVFTGGGNRCCPFVTETTTASDGTYSVAPASAGTYRVEVVPPAGSGLFERWGGGAGDAVEYWRAPDIAFANTVPVRIDVSLPSGAHTVSGRVKDATGNGLGYTLLLGFDATGRYSTIADANGDYRMTVSATMSVAVAVPPPGFLQTQRSSINAAIDPTGVDIICAAGFIISGTVSDSVSGAAIPSIHVIAQDPAGPLSFVDENFTDATGNYALTVANGSYKIQFTTHPWVTYSRQYARRWHTGKWTFGTADVLTVSGANVSGVNASIAPLFSVRGRVLDATSGAPVTYMLISTDASCGGFVFEIPGDTGAHGVDATGNWELMLPPGTWAIRASGNADYFDTYYGGATCGTATLVTVTNAPVSGIDIISTHR